MSVRFHRLCCIIASLWLALPAPAAHATDEALRLAADTPLTLDLPLRQGDTRYLGGSVVAVVPPQAGIATLTRSSVEDALRLSFTPARGHVGEVVIRYALQAEDGDITPASLTVDVAPRATPGSGSDAEALVNSQTGFARRAASAQLANVNPRLTQLHHDQAPRARSTLGLYLDGKALPLQSQRAVEGLSDTLPRGLSLWSAGSVYVGTDSGVDFNTGGLSLGADYLLTPSFSAGLSVGYGRGDNAVGADSEQQSDNTAVTLYGSYRPWSSFYLDGAVGYGWLRNDPTRLRREDDAQAAARRYGSQTYGSLAFGYDYRMDQLRINPYGRFDMTRSQLAAYAEDSSQAGALAVGEQAVQTRSGTVGMYLDRPILLETGRLTPSLRMEYQYWLRDTDDLELRYADQQDSAVRRVEGASAGSAQKVYGLGLDWALPDDLSLGLRVDRIDGETETSQRGTLNARKRF
ncbi:autotransporter outer membrane beta-barrel domain-containing protein [Chitiniphilus eburneus]|uniref:autotransporter outer membrane beta-barrel domain-containing protein n=1 Tax=Chitiniphilus eburneus TaxID=2571148 RepID=UPI00145CE1F5|nr:autotransporter outer membrane beta-barrel domain-containing protein [Chitiniphilus eburneus]